MDAVAIADSLVSGLAVALVLWVVKILKSHKAAHDRTEDFEHTTTTRLNRMETEFYPDSGKSLWDRIDATYNLMAQIAQQQGHYVRPQPLKEPKENKEP